MNTNSYILIEEWKKYGITAGTTTRIGGYSKYPFASFNMGRDTEDEYLTKNFNKLMEDFGWQELYKDNRIFFTYQIHKDNIKIIDKEAFEINKSDSYFYGVDGFLASYKDFENIVITVVTADCLPISILDKNNKVIAILHSGWKGTRLQILNKCLKLMKEKYNSGPEDILVHLGACIKPHNYEVSPEFKQYFKRNLMEKEGKYYFDIAGENKDIALTYGIPEENISDSGLCTYDEEELFYSHRRDKGITGRMLNFISID
ncbi:MAG: peptidoglycan editing factor PgeF [Spirochaetota bacterium]